MAMVVANSILSLFFGACLVLFVIAGCELARSFWHKFINVLNMRERTVAIAGLIAWLSLSYVTFINMKG